MKSQVVVHWVCSPCEVEGRDPDREPSCWNCGHPVTVIARPTIPMAGDADRAAG
jgi:DNA-directed RNA polymerase subunit RPC12/RpoP